jgi:hypothetical protein
MSDTSAQKTVACLAKGRFLSLIVCATTLLAPCLSALILPLNARADEIVLSNDQFVVFRDFSNIVIPEQDIDSVRAFFDAGPLSANSLSTSEEIKSIAVRLLEKRIKLVPQKGDANLLVQTRMYQTVNPAIRNPSREPAHGLVMVSVCKYPIAVIAKDCENLTYYFFADSNASEIFTKIFTIWLNSVFPKQTN